MRTRSTIRHDVGVVTDDDVIFETPRTRARLWRHDEADRVFDILRRWEVAQWLGDDPKAMSDRSEAVERIARWRERSNRHPGRGVWAIEEKATGVPAGSVLLVPLPNADGEVEVGWHLHPDAWGRGLASEAARGALAMAFDDGLDEGYAITHTTNAPSQRVCLRIGMRDLGVFHDRWYSGASQIFRITRSEWEAGDA